MTNRTLHSQTFCLIPNCIVTDRNVCGTFTLFYQNIAATIAAIIP